jgi:hypothetical protein
MYHRDHARYDSAQALLSPLHSHADPETFLSPSGRVRGLTFRGEDFEWIEIRPLTLEYVDAFAYSGNRGTA